MQQQQQQQQQQQPLSNEDLVANALIDRGFHLVPREEIKRLLDLYDNVEIVVDTLCITEEKINNISEIARLGDREHIRRTLAQLGDNFEDALNFFCKE